MNKGFTIAIDGPVASGKGTIAPKLAQKINGVHLYTGGTYRAVALFCLRNNIDFNNEEKVVSVLPQITIDILNENIILNGEVVNEELTDSKIARASSAVSVFRAVREKMVAVQQKVVEREVLNGKIIIAEGRDVGTKVLPHADIKIYLTASPEIRAKRRLEQYRKKGDNFSFDTVLKETIERDTRDTERELDPLVKEPEKFGYIVIDNSNQSEEETIGIIIEKICEKGIIL